LKKKSKRIKNENKIIKNVFSALSGDTVLLDRSIVSEEKGKF